MRRVQIGGLVSALACLVVWFALVVPNELGRMTLGAFVSIPLVGLVIVALALVLPPRTRRVVAALTGVLLGLLVLVKVLDLGFYAVLDRPFDALNDWTYLGPAVDVLGDWTGRAGAIVGVIAAGLLVIAVLVGLPLSVMRLCRVVADHRTVSVRTVVVLGIVWALCAVTGLRFSPDADVASASVAELAYDHVRRVRADIHDRQVFANDITDDRFGDTPTHQLLTGLRGKDVLLVFVESYGRVAVDDPELSPQVDAVLDAGTDRLASAGFSSRSAFITSPTFGAGSWLAHATMQSGLWVDSQQRYDQLLTEDRLTLTSAFDRAGWRTTFVLPADDEDWPAGQPFYHFDKLYDARDLDYRGPELGWGGVPDQYTLSELQRLELAPTDRAPLMAEIDLVSSHHPWSPPPPIVDWSRVGDGTVFDCMPECGESSGAGLQGQDDVRALYRESIEYTLRTLVSFVEAHPDPDLVLVMVGDHQPHSYVTGEGADHDVPITVIAHDPAVMARVSRWGWQAGMDPGADAPVWRMDAFRDRFLTAFGPH